MHKDSDYTPYTLLLVDQNTPMYSVVLKMREVFVTDQNHSQEALMEEDNQTDIYLLYFLGNPVGTARLHKKEFGWKIERVAVLKSEHKKGHGKVLMYMILMALAEKIKNKETVYLHSLTDASGFYEKCDFVIESDMFLELGLEHYKMRYVGEFPPKFLTKENSQVEQAC